MNTINIATYKASDSVPDDILALTKLGETPQLICNFINTEHPRLLCTYTEYTDATNCAVITYYYMLKCNFLDAYHTHKIRL